MQPYVTPFTLGSLGLTVALAGFGCLSAMLTQQIVPRGWRALRPGLGHWFAAVGNAAISALVAWIYIFVGSARHDAAFQMKVAFLLSIGFGLGAFVAAWHVRAIKRQNIRWRGSRVIRSNQEGVEQVYDGGRAVAWTRTWGGRWQLRFADGSTLYLDPFANGADEFMAKYGPLEGGDDTDGPP